MWATLLEIRSLQQEIGVRMDPIGRSIYLTALAKSAFGAMCGVVPDRQRQLVQLGKDVWDERDPSPDALNENIELNAALTVCAVARNNGGLSWARDLWRWAGEQEFEIDALPYCAYASVLETCQQHQEVDDMIQAAAMSGELWIQDVTLGALINAAAENKDWQRANVLWRRWTHEYGVLPDLIAYNIMSKALMVCGRVLDALHIWDGVCEVELNGNFKSVIDRAQLLLINCHSSPSQQNRRRLREALQSGSRVARQAKRAASEWKKIRNAAQLLEGSNIESVRFRDVLVEWKAKHLSDMKDWENHAGGSQYLGEAAAL